MKKLTCLALLFAPLVFIPSLALADVPSLQVAPLSYNGNLKTGAVSSGFIDVANPTDQTVNIVSNVQAFKQVDKLGDLTFSNNTSYASAITVGLPTFELGPRQAIRVAFTIDPTKLPRGGVYAAIFFRTQPTAQNSDSTYVLESANVGTLLILTNGGAGAHRGDVTGMSIPIWQAGGGLSGAIDFTNTDISPTAVAFKPSLTAKIMPWGKPASMRTGLLLPGVTRTFSFAKPGSYIGLLLITFRDSQTGTHTTAWVLAVTGVYRFVAPAALAVIVLLSVGLPYLRRKRPAQAPAPVILEESADLPVEYVREQDGAESRGEEGEATGELEAEDELPDPAPQGSSDDRAVYGLYSELDVGPAPAVPDPDIDSQEIPLQTKLKSFVKVKLESEAPKPAPGKPKGRPKRKRRRLDAPSD